MKFKAYSQHVHITDPAWQYRSCGVVSLMILMEALNPNTQTTPDQLVQEGLELGAYKEGVGWYHAGLARLATAHGFTSTNKDWSTKSSEEARALLQTELNEGPCIASITTPNGGHLIVIEKIEGDEAVVHDCGERVDIQKTIPLEDFYKNWTQRIISVKN
jgi:ABC-type bacteriocin/lantibiotic exporter with double-glycine peptidase domain